MYQLCYYSYVSYTVVPYYNDSSHYYNSIIMY